MLLGEVRLGRHDHRQVPPRLDPRRERPSARLIAGVHTDALEQRVAVHRERERVIVPAELDRRASVRVLDVQTGGAPRLTGPGEVDIRDTRTEADAPRHQPALQRCSARSSSRTGCTSCGRPRRACRYGQTPGRSAGSSGGGPLLEGERGPPHLPDGGLQEVLAEHLVDAACTEGPSARRSNGASGPARDDRAAELPCQ